MTTSIPQEQVSENLSPERVLSLTRALPRVLTEMLGKADLVVLYGAGCGIHGDLWLVPMRVNTSWLAAFLEKNIEQMIFYPGDSELRIRSADDRLRITFCNERHIHIGGTDMSLREEFLSKDPFSGVVMDGWSNEM